MSLYPKQLKFEESKRSALKGFAEEHSIKPPTDQKFDPKTFLITVKQKAMETLKGTNCQTCDYNKQFPVKNDGYFSIN